MTVLGDVTAATGGGTPGTSIHFRLVGHNSLFGRGMNAALTIFDHYVYVGNRSDGSNLPESAQVMPVRQQKRQICRQVTRTEATGLEPATSGVTNHCEGAR